MSSGSGSGRFRFGKAASKTRQFIQLVGIRELNQDKSERPSECRLRQYFNDFYVRGRVMSVPKRASVGPPNVRCSVWLRGTAWVFGALMMSTMAPSSGLTLAELGSVGPAGVGSVSRFIRSRTASHFKRVSMGMRLVGLDSMSKSFFIFPSFS